MGIGKVLVGLGGATIAVGMMHKLTKKTRKKLKKNKLWI